MIVLKIIGAVIAFTVAVIFFAFFIVGIHYLVWFHRRSCKYCNHTLEFKGLKEDDGNGHYLFHCPECGAWEQIPKEEFFRDVNRGFNPHEFPV